MRSVAVVLAVKEEALHRRRGALSGGVGAPRGADADTLERGRGWLVPKEAALADARLRTADCAQLFSSQSLLKEAE